jgi:adiponectin receptor
MDLHYLQRLPDMIRSADFHKIHPELLNCLPSLPNLSDFKTSLPSMDFLSSVSGNLVELVTNCLPERFSHAYQSENSVMVLSCSLTLKW